MGTCTYIEDQGIIEVVYSDEITGDELRSDRESGIKLVGEKGVRRVLVDSRSATLNLSHTATYEHGVAMSGFGAFNGVRFAIVTLNVHANDSLLKQVATNRGGIIQIFESRNDALAWLKGS